MCEQRNDFTHQATLILPINIDADKEQRSISADKCMVKVLTYLWKNNIETKSHCCGHGKRPPSIVVNEVYGDDEIEKICKIIKEVDSRDFEIYQWKIALVKPIIKATNGYAKDFITSLLIFSTIIFFGIVLCWLFFSLK